MIINVFISWRLGAGTIALILAWASRPWWPR
jgi:hypothetical protein